MHRLKALVVSSLLMVAPIANADFSSALQAYNNGEFVKAATEFQQLALMNHRQAQFYLGEIYDGGVGVKQDYVIALDWYLQSARQGNSKAQLRAAWMYSKGLGVEQDHSSALRWNKLAAEAGEPLAQYRLALQYANGLGTPRDRVFAYKWWTIAASYGDPDAMDQRNIIAGNMSKNDIQRATTLAREWEKNREAAL